MTSTPILRVAQADPPTAVYTAADWASNVVEPNWNWTETTWMAATAWTTTSTDVRYEWTYDTGTGSQTLPTVWAVEQGTSLRRQVPVVNSYSYTPVPAPAMPVISQEEADRRLRETRRQRHVQAIRRRRAEKKGRKLLLSLLSETQKWEYAKKGQFTVCGADGNWYVLRKGRTVHQIGGDGRATHSHCIHLPYSYIDEDTLISLKLLIETDVQEFLRIANTSVLRNRGHMAVDHYPVTLQARAAAIAGGMNAVAAHLRNLGESAVRAADAMVRLHEAASYAEYARELEAQVVAEECGLLLPLEARQVRVAQALGQTETIGGTPVDPLPEVVLAA